MISNEKLQEAFIARMKGDGGITIILGADTEIREQQWQGRAFTYPAVRLALGTQVPLAFIEPCEWSLLSFSVLCLSEKRSSKEADELAGAVNVCFHNSAWDEALDNFRLHKIRSVGLNSATRMSERIWRAEAFFQARIHTI